MYEGANAHCHGEHLYVGTARVADNREQRASFSYGQCPAHREQHARPRHHDECQRGEGEGHHVAEVGHPPSVTAMGGRVRRGTRWARG